MRPQSPPAGRSGEGPASNPWADGIEKGARPILTVSGREWNQNLREDLGNGPLRIFKSPVLPAFGDDVMAWHRNQRPLGS
jgi:hypothetical protein